MFNNIKKNKLAIIVVLISIIIFTTYVIVRAYAVDHESPFMVCGHLRPYQSEFEPPRNTVYKSLWKSGLFQPLCDWLRREFGLKYGFKEDLVFGEISAAYLSNFADDRILMGAAHNVFVGEVVGEVGVLTVGSPETQYEVEVIYSIKGDLKNKIMLSQQGGYRGGILYVMESDDLLLPIYRENYLLKPRNIYLFATRYNSQKNWHKLISHPNARKLISSDPNPSKSQLQSLVESDPKVQALKEAYKNEILLEADIYHNNTRNSYESLHPEEIEK